MPPPSPNTASASDGIAAGPLLKNLHWAALAWIACFEVAWGVAWGLEQLAAIIRPLA